MLTHNYIVYTIVKLLFGKLLKLAYYIILNLKCNHITFCQNIIFYHEYDKWLFLKIRNLILQKGCHGVNALYALSASNDFSCAPSNRTTALSLLFSTSRFVVCITLLQTQRSPHYLSRNTSLYVQVFSRSRVFSFFIWKMNATRRNNKKKKMLYPYWNIFKCIIKYFTKQTVGLFIVKNTVETKPLLSVYSKIWTLKYTTIVWVLKYELSYGWKKYIK